MKNTILLTTLAVLSAAPALAQTQSNVTLYGRVDLGLARNIGDDTWKMQQGSGSRLGLRGSEDLGGGLKAIFNIEHRFSADDGTVSSSNPFWHGRSVLGLQGGFGTVTLGREYTPVRNVSNPLDPWGGDTVAAHEGNLLGTVAPQRKNNAITYSTPELGGFKAQAQVSADEVAGNDTKATYGLNLAYAAGPLSVSYGFDKSAKEDATWHLVGGSYDLGPAKLLGAFGSGKNTDGDKRRSFLVGATAPLGGGELRVGYSKLEAKDPDEDLSSKFGIGYHYPLSKRTVVYVDVANDSEADSDKTGVDFGLKHNF
ncbi:porin [Aquabacterium sp. A7-Y]|uniref:porin n=1 Tax=Aquabacterium sp. A7-Y TaxID=1349605 RepID=UPI00223DB91A|nr:porin [Aquabacterium sp. A7-Y]MCW7540359.1 porin [Aquabacterium sp. A7-Y]